MKNTTTFHTSKTSKIIIASVLSLVFLNGCAMTPNKANTEILTQQQAKIETILQQQQQILTTLQSQPDKFSEQDKAITKLTEQLDDLSAATQAKKAVPIVVPVIPNTRNDTLNKVVLGQEEWVWFDELKTNFKSRVDTGATTSSLNATEIIKFERDGQDWVKFNLSHNNDESAEFPIEAPIVRTIKIRQTNAPEAVRRYVVSLPIELGEIKTDTEFTLADRNSMTFPVLLGRSFLKDIAIVDVAKEYTQPKKKPLPTKPGAN